MFEPYNFVRNLEYMGKGMLAIFVVMIIIYARYRETQTIPHR